MFSDVMFGGNLNVCFFSGTMAKSGCIVNAVQILVAPQN